MEVECDFCNKMFVRASGHLCWCEECSKPHPMCNVCYELAKDDGDIVDADIPRNSISEENKQRYS
jgi:hypothetical protein